MTRYPWWGASIVDINNQYQRGLWFYSCSDADRSSAYTISQWDYDQYKPIEGYEISHDEEREDQPCGRAGLYANALGGIIVVCPNANVGPMISAKHQGYPTSARFVAALARHEYDSLLGTPPQHFIHVQDDAKLHIIALAHPDLLGRRILAMVNPFNLQDMVESLRRLYPSQTWEDFPEGGRDLSEVQPKAEVEALLRDAYGTGFLGLHDAVRGNAQDILD